MNDWQSYPDSTLRETYPPAPTRGGAMNKEAPEAIIGMIANSHASSVQHEAEFRERQRRRRLQTRGAAAMREPEESLSTPVLDLPDDPALEEYKVAGWFR